MKINHLVKYSIIFGLILTAATAAFARVDVGFFFNDFGRYFEPAPCVVEEVVCPPAPCVERRVVVERCEPRPCFEEVRVVEPCAARERVVEKRVVRSCAPARYQVIEAGCDVYRGDTQTGQLFRLTEDFCGRDLWEKQVDAWSLKAIRRYSSRPGRFEFRMDSCGIYMKDTRNGDVYRLREKFVRSSFGENYEWDRQWRA